MRICCVLCLVCSWRTDKCSKLHHFWLIQVSVSVRTEPEWIQRLWKPSHAETSKQMTDILMSCSKSGTACVLHILTIHWLVQHSQHNHILIHKRASVDSNKGRISLRSLSLFQFMSFLSSSFYRVFVSHLVACVFIFVLYVCTLPVKGLNTQPDQNECVDIVHRWKQEYLHEQILN